MKFNVISIILAFLLIPPFFTPSQGRAATIKGFVKDVRNGETLSYVNVILEGEKYGTVSDKNGYYVIGDLPPGELAKNCRGESERTSLSPSLSGKGRLR